MTYFRAGQPDSCSRRRRRHSVALHSAVTVVVASLPSSSDAVHVRACASRYARVLQPTTGTTTWQQPQPQAQPCGNSHHHRHHHVAAATTAGTTMWQHPQPQAQPCGSSHDSRHVAQGQIVRNCYSDGTKNNWPADQGLRLVSRRFKQQRCGCARRCGRGCARPAHTVSLLTA